MFRWRLAACLSGLLAMTACAAAPEFVSDPTVAPNPNERAPLVALISFEAANASATRVALDDGERQWTIEFPRHASPEEPLVILGMRPGRRHPMQVSILDAADTAVSATPLVFETPLLPVDRYEMPARQVEVFDVTGAGDTSAAVLAVASAIGWPPLRAAQLANLASSIVVTKSGTAPVSGPELAMVVAEVTRADRGVMDRAQLMQAVEQARQLGERIVFTNGC